MKIRVVGEDIEGASRASACHCPVANALKRHFRTGMVSVLPFGAYVGNRTFRHSKATEQAIANYDLTGVMVPFEAVMTEVRK